MSKRSGISGIRSLLAGMLDWCKKTAGSRWRGRDAVWSATDGCRNEQVETPQLTDVRDALQVDFSGKPVDLKEFIERLHIGERIRVLCDDGVLVAEKISETQFKLIHSQMMSKFVH